MSRDELIVVVHRQAGQITEQDQQITAQAGQRTGADGDQRGVGREVGPAGASLSRS